MRRRRGCASRTLAGASGKGRGRGKGKGRNPDRRNAPLVARPHREVEGVRTRPEVPRLDLQALVVAEVHRGRDGCREQVREGDRTQKSGRGLLGLADCYPRLRSGSDLRDAAAAAKTRPAPYFVDKGGAARARGSARQPPRPHTLPPIRTAASSWPWTASSWPWTASSWPWTASSWPWTASSWPWSDIGSKGCRPSRPRRDACPLGAPCPRLGLSPRECAASARPPRAWAA